MLNLDKCNEVSHLGLAVLFWLSYNAHKGFFSDNLQF